MYGVNKVAGELLCDYYFHRFGLDTRGVRFPGLISYVAQPGGGTTDYAVDIYYKALEEGKYTSYIAEGTHMDMMYMPDALQAIVDLMEADSAKLIHRNAFNVTAMSLNRRKLPHQSGNRFLHLKWLTMLIRYVRRLLTVGRTRSTRLRRLKNGALKQPMIWRK